MGPLAFSILLHPIIERIQREVPGLLLNAWYLDDGILTGTPADLLSALNIIEDMGPLCGLQLNRSKSLLFLPPGVESSQSSLPSDIPLSSSGFVLLGSPIGPPEFCCESISKRLDKVKESVKLLALLEDSQLEYSLLRSCLSLQKISCALRTTAPDIVASVIQDFDEFMFHCISDLVGGSLSSWYATLPPRLGGIGIRLAHAHSSATFLSSVYACSSLIFSLSNQVVPPSYTTAAFSLFHSVTGLTDISSFDDFNCPVSQKSLSRLVDQNAFDGLLSLSSDDRSMALLLSTSIPGVIPSSNLGLHFLDAEFRLCLRYWLGIPPVS